MVLDSKRRFEKRIRTLSQRKRNSAEGVFARIGERLRLVVRNFLNPEIAQHLKDGFAGMTEGYRAMMRVVVGNQNMAVEAIHFWNGEDADAAKRAGGNRQNLTLGHIGPEAALCRSLQPVEGNLAGQNIPFQSAAGDVRLAVRLETALHDELMLHRCALQAAGGGVAAVKAHEGLVQPVVILAGDVCIIDVSRD